MSSVYLLHFEQPIPRGTSPRGTALICGHYLGYASRLHERLARHKAGNGARLMSVLHERGIAWALARTWSKGTRNLERRLKRRHNLPKLCPICRGKKAFKVYENH